jgi:hypothetical protein
MSESILQRLMNRLRGKPDAASDEVEEEVPMQTGRASIASDVDSKRWFDGKPPIIRDSIDSDPGSARWFRRPKFVAPGDTLHHPSKVSIR